MTAALLLLSLAAAASTPTPREVNEDTRPAPLREIGFDQRLGQSLPLDTVFRDEQGHEVRLGQYFGKRPVILALVYYECPMLCTLTLNGMVQSFRVLKETPGKDFEVVTVSFDPREGPDLAATKKAGYMKSFKRPGAEKGWHFLTGQEDSIKKLTQAVGFRYVWDDRTQQFAHATGIIVTTPDGRLTRYLYGIEYAPKDVRFALIEASQGRIGSPVDQIILSCYRYDPTTGRYGVYALGLMRLLGVITVLAIGTFMVVMWRVERRGSAAAAAAAAGQVDATKETKS